MNGKIKGRGVILDLKDDNGTTINEDMDKANTFNSFFSSVFTGEDMSHLPDLSRKLTQKDLEEKDLGVWIDDKLKFTKHIGHAVAKGNQILGLIQRSFVYKDSEVIKRLFIAHV